MLLDTHAQQQLVTLGIGNPQCVLRLKALPKRARLSVIKTGCDGRYRNVVDNVVGEQHTHVWAAPAPRLVADTL
ncbi:hypothetical protein D3C80_1831000 [compost metagenome]